MSKPVIGCKPYYIAIPERIVELSYAIAAHADCKAGIVETWAKEIVLLTNVMREMDREKKEDSLRNINTATEPCPYP